MTTVNFFSINREIYWGLFIALYFFYTGMSAGSFILTSLGGVFGIEKYKKIAKTGVILAIVLLAFAPLHLIIHLAQPGRFLTLLYRINLTSPMSWGVYLLLLYPLVLVIYAWFLFRQDMVRGLDKGGFKASVYRFLLFGKTDMSEAAKEHDRKKQKLFGTVGVPLALMVHGYTGFILGVVEARAIWYTPLMPFIFLMSAMVSGTGLFALVLLLVEKFKFGKIHEDIKSLIADIANLMKWFIFADAILMIVYFITLWYSGETSYAAAYYFLYKETGSFLGIEIGVGLLLPFIIVFSKKGRQSITAVVIASIMTIIGVLFMRINFVVGGQRIPLTNGQIPQFAVPGWEVGAIVAIAAAAVAVLVFIYSIMPMNRPGVEEKTAKTTSISNSNAKGVAQ